MPAAIPVTCPRCGHAARLKNPAALGKKKPCPACGEPFTLRADDPAAAFADDFDEDFDEIPAAPPRRSAASRPPARARTRNRGGGGGSNRAVWWVLGGAALGVLVLCGGGVAAVVIPAVQQAEQAAERNAANAAAMQAPPAPLADTTADQAAALGERFVAAADRGDAAAVAALFDPEALLETVSSGMTVPPDLRRAVLTEYRTLPPQLAAQYVTADLRFLGVRQVPGVDGPPGATVRMVGADGSLNYLVLFPTPGGKIGDIYGFATGERVSATLRRPLGVLLSGSPEEKRAVAQMDALQAAANRGDAATVERLYAGLPESLKASRAVQMARSNAAVDDPALTAEVAAEIDRRFPGDPTMDLLRIGGQADDPAALVATLGRLDAAVGGDAHLKGLRAENLPDAGRPEEALAVGRAAVAGEPGLPQAQFGLLAGLISTGDFAAAADVLRTLRDEHELAFEPAALAPLYPRAEEFTQSPEYAAFRRE